MMGHDFLKVYNKRDKSLSIISPEEREKSSEDRKIMSNLTMFGVGNVIVELVQ